MKPQIFFQTWLDGHLCIVFVKNNCALTSVPTFACLQKLTLRDASPALNCLFHVHRARMGAQFSAGRVLENLISRDRIGQYSPAGRDGHQIHPCRVRWIDSVKINPSLVMMRECIIPGHVKVDVLDPVLVGQELVEVVDVRHELLAEQTLVLPPLPLLHQVDHHHWTAIPSNTTFIL